MHAAFDASQELDYDPLRTAEEIQRCGYDLLFWLEALSSSEEPRPPDVLLLREIHLRWFETTFPAAAGRERTAVVLNRKNTAAAPHAILPAVDSVCGNWSWRHENYMPADGPDLIEFIVSEANTLTVATYDIHPFIDGNTRTTWHLRNYLLMLDGLRPIVDLVDEEAHDEAWWAASPHDHAALDRAVLAELAARDR